MDIDKSTMKENKITSLFLEPKFDRLTCVYTLNTFDQERYPNDPTNDEMIPSIKRLYLEMEDVHEYEFANKYFLSWRHWQAICNSPILKPYVEEWRLELEVKLRARNLKRMEQLAADGDRQAIRYMADKSWIQPETPKRGRPSKDEVKGKLNQEAIEQAALEEEWRRIQ